MSKLSSSKFCHSTQSIFADDTNIFADVSKTAGQESLQSDLHNATKWSQKWQLPFNVNKCKVLHIGKTNPRVNYIMNDVQLADTKQEKDFRSNS